MIEIWTDGACSGNGKEDAIGGFAWIMFQNGLEICSSSGKEKNTTNQRMEIMAAIDALNNVPLDTPVCIHTDSAYLYNCWNSKWYVNWEKSGWINSKKQPVANQDLWEKIIPFFKKSNISFIKTKGHGDDEINNRVDKAAVAAMREQ